MGNDQGSVDMHLGVSHGHSEVAMIAAKQLYYRAATGVLLGAWGAWMSWGESAPIHQLVACKQVDQGGELLAHPDLCVWHLTSWVDKNYIWMLACGICNNAV